MVYLLNWLDFRVKKKLLCHFTLIFEVMFYNKKYLKINNKSQFNNWVISAHPFKNTFGPNLNHLTTDLHKIVMYSFIYILKNTPVSKLHSEHIFYAKCK